jgi:hypothetical protein
MKKQDVEKKAIKAAIEYELSRGRKPLDVSKNNKHAGYDILSGGIKIEVKGRGKQKGPHLLLNENNIKCIESSNNKNYRLYGVINTKKNPKIIIFNKKDILKSKHEERLWRIPLRKKDYLGAEDVKTKKKK